MRKLIWLVLCVSLAALPICAEESHSWIVIFDLTDRTGGTEFSGNRVFSCSAEHKGAFKNVLANANGIQGAFANAPQLDKDLKECDDRWLGSTGDRLDIYVILNENSTSKVGVDEKTRKSQISTDLSTLLKVINVVTGVTQNLKVEHTVYLLTKTRANLTVTAAIEVPASIVGSATAPSTPLKTEIITGPTEHWFLSADLPVNSVNQLKFDESSHSLVPKEEPNQFYVGLNYKLGDLFKGYSGADIWKGLVLKGILLGQKDPLESYGVALAYRRKPGTFSPFVGWTFTEEDSQKANGSVEEKGSRNSEVRFGLSFNLDQALTWLKKDS